MALREKTLMINAKNPETPADTLVLPARINSVLNQRGFTLVEMIVAFAIIAVLAIISLSSFGNVRNKTKESICAREIRDLERDINAFTLDKGYLPPGLVDIGKGGILDPWGRPYEYKIFVTTEMRYLGVKELNNDYDLYSKGINGTSDLSIEDPSSEDDVARLQEGMFVGTAKLYMN